MNFNKHSELEGQHAFLSASSYHWLRYDEAKLRTVWKNWRAQQRGTELHELAASLIRMGIALPNNGSTLSEYVNDAIRYLMSPEVVLWYSDNCFGTADAIGFQDMCLRIYDLKTGTHKASMDQLRIYAALFCLEYDVDPHSIGIELRIYQSDEVREEVADPDVIFSIIERIIQADKEVTQLKEEELSNV